MKTKSHEDRVKTISKEKTYEEVKEKKDERALFIDLSKRVESSGIQWGAPVADKCLLIHVQQNQ